MSTETFYVLWLGMHAIPLLAGVYMVVTNRVPPPRTIWGDSPSRPGKLVRPRLLGIWYVIWWCVLTLVAVLQVVTRASLLLSLWSLIIILMGLALTNRRFAKLGIYQHPPSHESTTSSESDDVL